MPLSILAFNLENRIPFRFFPAFTDNVAFCDSVTYLMCVAKPFNHGTFSLQFRHLEGRVFIELSWIFFSLPTLANHFMAKPLI